MNQAEMRNGFETTVAYKERVTNDPVRSTGNIIEVGIKERANTCIGTDLGELEVAWAHGPAWSTKRQ